MRTSINILNTPTKIYNKNIKKNIKHIYTTKHINNANNSPLIEKKFKNNTTKTNKKINKKNE